MKILLSNIPRAIKKLLIESLEILKGEKVGIIGKTGSGKSTLINIIIDLLKPTDGNIFIDDKKIDNNANVANLISGESKYHMFLKIYIYQILLSMKT